MALSLRCVSCDHDYSGEDARTPCPRCGKPATDSYRPAPARARARASDGTIGEGSGSGAAAIEAPTKDPSTSARHLEPGPGTMVNGYRLEERVGDGATSAVYRAIDPKNDAKVAVKMLSAKDSGDHEALERFSREARLARRIKHPNLVHVHDSGVDDQTGRHYLVMDLVEGETLAEMIERERRLGWRQALEFVYQIAQAVDLLRRHGCVHRDIKPANILIADGVAKLTDLGFVKPVSESPNDRDALIMGTPAYMAPEQTVDAREATHAADVYALGATLYHALTGQAPFGGGTADQIMAKVQRETPTPPRVLVPSLPESVELLVTWSMAKDPSKRPPDANAFSRSIGVILGNPDNTDNIKRARARVTRPLVQVVVVVVSAGILAALFVLLLNQGTTGRPQARPIAPFPPRDVPREPSSESSSDTSRDVQPDTPRTQPEQVRSPAPVDLPPANADTPVTAPETVPDKPATSPEP